jgi:hypothetical protein
MSQHYAAVPFPVKREVLIGLRPNDDYDLIFVSFEDLEDRPKCVAMTEEHGGGHLHYFSFAPRRPFGASL